MRNRLTRFGWSAVALARRTASYGRRKAVAFGELWRRSVQFRVTVSTLALSSAVVFVLGLVLQNQIIERLMDTKERAAFAQLQVVVQTAENELVGDAGQDEALRNRLGNALKKVTSSSVATQDVESSAAGAFEPVLAAGDPDESTAHAISAGPYEKVPAGLRNFVQNNAQAKQIHTIGSTTYLVVGAPVTTTTRPLQLYLLFPLTTEQNTVATVQNTLLVGGLVLLLLLASISNMVTRQVVRPVRRAAAAAERFAEGELDRRLDVVGEDDLAKLAQSYNEMAASIQRQIRQLEEFGQLQRRFTSDVSHELRTPLTTVRMAADVLHASREQFPAGLARSTELLVDELDRFETLLRDLLEISRLDAGVEELAAELIDVRPIARRAVEQVKVLAGTAGSVIELDLPDDEVTAEVDARRVERILRNLLANAIDHGEGKPVLLRLAASDNALALTVRDYGVGLRPGEAELVFNRFWRADPSRNRRTGGTGLGLAISQEDARLHGGRLDAWGAVEGGSCFRLTLPRSTGEPIEHSPLPLRDLPALPAGGGGGTEEPDGAEPPENGEDRDSGSADGAVNGQTGAVSEHEEAR
ncbi:two-component sensor histidine kinase [Prauserella marina]|uniref:Sensor histidine kinase MtrB n=1 Tax=Prauserella marina TaxID=530584 RepID=A0A222VVI3_9PSEU|nr:MtrAB system histidine kinase MtrB [Prauserella marina]ASR37914.1 two-component sensor histidine kinase [Prauserella marina]PWV73121.1 two-component system sensor histidine kinase MtrB [Prauserella marina]SDD71325.1 two-component system, OmpR family, sensor histidine kinase MtrB [Prauserella marina]